MKKTLAILLLATTGFFTVAKTDEKKTAKKTGTKKSVTVTKKSSTTAKKTVKISTVKKSNTKKTASSSSGTSAYQTGVASFYGGKWHGKKTANGEIFDTYSLTAAHKTLPFNTRVKVTNLRNGKSVIVRINNRGPYKKGRIIDLSTAAFTAIESRDRGVTRVKLQVLK